MPSQNITDNTKMLSPSALHIQLLSDEGRSCFILLLGSEIIKKLKKIVLTEPRNFKSTKVSQSDHKSSLLHALIVESSNCLKIKVDLPRVILTILETSAGFRKGLV